GRACRAIPNSSVTIPIHRTSNLLIPRYGHATTAQRPRNGRAMAADDRRRRPLDGLFSLPMPSAANMEDGSPTLEIERSIDPRADRQDALERLYREYHGCIYALCYRMLGNAEDAQDATQAAFVRAF